MIAFEIEMPDDAKPTSDSLGGRDVQVLPQSAFLSLGSNLGDRAANLQEACERMSALGLQIIRASSIYETEPVGFKDQPWFLNEVVEVRVDPERLFSDGAAMADLHQSDPALSWPVYELHKALQAIEREMGRERLTPNRPRVIDIDLLLCGDRQGCWAEPRDANGGFARAGRPFLILPHPRMHERRFVMEPLCEIAPEVIHPVLKKTAREILASLDDPSIVRLYHPAPAGS
jgi:2-amino-4-hydroxy-6-hydroxymethyldihydropteridine diphosphokinase